MRTSALILIALTAFFCVPALGAAKIYKWTDANGQVHFDSSPPPGQTAEKVRIRGGVDAPPAAPTTATATSTNSNAADSGKIEMSPQQRAELGTYCNSMRERISVLKQGGSVVEKNPDGSRVELDTAAVSQKLSADEANVKTYCAANGL